jgi:enoyl-CoA hydratase/carnithine racemase
MQPCTDQIIAERDGPIGRLILNNPDRRNAVSLAMWQAMPGIVENFMSDVSVRVVVLAGAGGKAFSSGADISEFRDRRSTRDGIAAYAAAGRRAYDALASIEKPTIAMIRGYCIGGGVEIAQLCDIQIASDDSRFAVTPARLGLGYKLDDVQLLVSNIGAKHAKELLFTGRQFSAAEALTMGLVNRVVPAGELEAVVEDTARTIAANAPLSVRAAKTIIGEALKEPGSRDVALCEALVDACYASADYREGQTAFAEKREPQFVGR